MVKITLNEWLLVIALTTLAILMRLPATIRGLNNFSPIAGFLLYYGILYLLLLGLSTMGLIKYGKNNDEDLFSRLKKSVGISILLFSFFMVVNYTSPFELYANTGNIEQLATQSMSSDHNIIYQSEDGATWSAWSHIITPNTTLKVWIVWALTFPITVFTTALIGVLFLEKKAEF